MLNLSNLDVKIEEKSPVEAKVIVLPLDRGFGYTLGSSLRRVLLSSIKGGAVTSVKIDGVTHEFSTKEGVSEDVMQIILNLKSLNFVMGDTDKATISIDRKGPCVVTAEDFECSDAIGIVNKDLVVANLGDNAQLKLEAIVSSGYGYQQAISSTETSGDSNWINIDAVFSPVKNVSIEVVDTRVQNRVNLDKLILNIKTNGSMSPSNVFARSIDLLLENYSGILSKLPGNEPSIVPKTISNTDGNDSDNNDSDINLHDSIQDVAINDDLDVLEQSIEFLGLSVRASNSLKSEGVKYIKDLIKMNKDDLMNIQNLGKKSVVDIIAILENNGLKLQN